VNIKNIHTILNITIDLKLNTTEISIFQDALLLSQSKNDFSLNRHHLRFKTGEKLTKQAISKSIISLENKGLLIQIGKNENRIQHKLNVEVFNV
jgi:hypothetical protein